MIIDGIHYGLTAEQIAMRRFSIGGSDANIIMSGDKEKIHQLWLEKTGQAPNVDLSDVLAVQMGIHTEAFNRAWYTKQTGNFVYMETVPVTKGYGIPMSATLDGMVIINDEKTVFEAKHVTMMSNMDEQLERYYPQLVHNMKVTGYYKAVLSVFFGNAKWDHVLIEYDRDYGAELLKAERAFWSHVENMTPPVDIETSVKPVARQRLSVDMTGNNEFASNADAWIRNRDASAAFDAAKNALKKLLPDEADEAYGYGITVKASKSGAITVKEMKK
jgi:predicted phage-related endonuclease